MKLKHVLHLVCVSILLGVVLVNGSRSTAYADSLIVNTLVDENDHSCGDGDCSLRDAIEVAESGDTITFTVTGTITLVVDQLTLDKDLTIDGPGASNLSISGDYKFRVFQVNPGVTVSITGITVAHGQESAGQGVRNEGTLTVNESVFWQNGRAGYSGEGAGIYNTGTLTVNDCSFLQNNASEGGGIFNSGTAIVTQTTFAGNSVHMDYGGQGGGIYNLGALTVTNSTIYSNSTSGSYKYAYGTGGGIANSGTLTVSNATFSDNSFGGNISGTAIVKNTIFANGGCSGSQIDDGGNLRWPLSDSSCVGKYGDPKLQPLTDNGGPTQTMSLDENSPALEYGDPAICPAADQRGELRPNPPGSVCDIGAYESNLRPTVLTWEDDDPRVQYGGWRGEEFTDERGTDRVSRTRDDTVAFQFTGRHVVWITRRGPDMGIAQVKIDGIDKGLVDLYHPSEDWKSEKKFKDLAFGKHTMVIKVTGGKNANASDTNIAIDAFKVRDLTPDTASGVKYAKWYGSVHVSASGGSYRASKKKNAVVLLKFTGTRIDWITARGPAYGKAVVSIDGVEKGRYDLYASNQEWDVPITFAGLSASQHTIEIRVLGKKNASSNGKQVVVDAFSQPVELP